MRTGTDRTVVLDVLRLVGGRTVVLAFSLLTLVVTARTLGPDSFGLLQFALALFFYVSLLTDLGLTISGVRDLARGERSPTLIAEVVGLRVWLATMALVAILVLAVSFPSAEARILLVLALGGLAAAGTVTWVLQAATRFVALSAVEVGGALAQLLVVILLVRGPDDGLAAAVAVAVGAASLTVGSWALVRPDPGKVVAAIARPALRLLPRALPLGIAFIAISIYYNVDALLLGLLRSNAEVGYYAVAYRPVLALLTVAFAAASVATPVLARLLVDAPNRVPQLLKTLSHGLLALALPAAVGGMIAGEAVIVAVFGDEYRPSVLPFAILVWSCVAVFANAPASALVIAQGRDRWYLAAAVTGAAVNIVANLMLIPLGGTSGAATATLIAHTVVLGIFMFSVRGVAIRPIVFALTRLAVPTALMAAAIWPFRESLIAVPIGAFVYAAALFATGAVPRWDKGEFTDHRTVHEIHDSSSQ